MALKYTKSNLQLSKFQQDDEIDLFELFKILWIGKWVIFAFLGISLAFGLFVNFYKEKSLPPSHFAVLAPYTINLFSPFDEQICSQELKCIYDRVSRRLKKIAEDSWSINKFIKEEWEAASIELEEGKTRCPMDFCLELTTRSPQELKFYEAQLQKYNVLLTRALETDLKNEFLSLSEDSFIQIDSQTFVQNFTELKRYLNVIEKGEMVIRFGEIDISKVTPSHKQNLILALSLILGGFFGCAIVLLRSVISSRRNVAL